MKRSNVKKIRRFLIEYFNLEEFHRSYWFTRLLSNLLYELQRNELKLFEVFREISLIARTGESFMRINTTITRRGEGGNEGEVGGDRNRKGKVAQSRLTFPKTR